MSNETTWILRKGLTGRGIEWRSGLEGVTWVGDWCFVEYDDGKLAATCEPVLTADQAVAATLVSEREKELEELVRDWQVLAGARLDDEIALLKRITELEGQRDELRKMAAAMSERGSAIGLDYGMGLGLVDAARMMREAADTIDSLRDRLQAVGETCRIEWRDDSYDTDAMGQSSTHSKAQSKTEPDMSEQSELLSDEVDSREKLEADVRKNYSYTVTTLMYPPSANKSTDMLKAVPVDTVIGWLDRQAAIIEREWQESNDRLIDTMRTTSEQYREKIAELQTRVDELTAQLHVSNAERARLRECLGTATDHAHDLLTLVDESGNVYDCDEGLA